MWIIMELKEIKQILKLMDEHGLSEFTLERDGEKLIIKGQIAAVPMQPQAIPQMVPQAAAPAAPAAAPAAAPEVEPVDDSIQVITSPMVGTFYAAPSPDSEPFVRPGVVINPDSTVGIIEAMKIMNEIKAEISGTITEMCVTNGQAIEFGQELFKVKVS